MTRGAGTTPAWAVPGAWPGSGVPAASSVVSQQIRFSDFLGGRDSSEIFPDGRAEKTKVVGVPPGLGTCFSISGGCTGPYFFFWGISALDGETKFWVTNPPACLEILGVASPATTALAVRDAGLRGVVEFRLTVSSNLGMGFTTVEISGCLKKTLFRECGVS